MKPLNLSAPLTVNWTLSFRCNFHCRHCYSREEDAATELSTQEVKAVMDKLSAHRIPFINFGGGEPLLRKDLFEVTRYAADLGFRVSMNTNGYLMDAGRAEKVREAGYATVGVSIDSHSADVHDAFRNTPGSFGRAVRAVQLLRGEGVRVTISSVICRINADSFESLVEMAAELGAEQLFLHNYKCAGMGMRNRDELDLPPSQWRTFYESALAVKERTKAVRISLDDPITCSLPGAEADKTMVKGSTCGKLSLNVRANGDVTPCGFIPVTVGNLLRDDFSEIWNRSDVLHALRNKKPKDKCAACRHYDDCLGGCSARAYASTGDFESPDPHCWMEPA